VGIASENAENEKTDVTNVTFSPFSASPNISNTSSSLSTSSSLKEKELVVETHTSIFNAEKNEKAEKTDVTGVTISPKPMSIAEATEATQYKPKTVFSGDEIEIPQSLLQLARKSFLGLTPENTLIGWISMGYPIEEITDAILRTEDMGIKGKGAPSYCRTILENRKAKGYPKPEMTAYSSSSKSQEPAWKRNGEAESTEYPGIPKYMEGTVRNTEMAREKAIRKRNQELISQGKPPLKGYEAYV